MEVWKIIFLSKWVICRFHVNLPGCTVSKTNRKFTPHENKPQPTKRNNDKTIKSSIFRCGDVSFWKSSWWFQPDWKTCMSNRRWCLTITNEQCYYVPRILNLNKIVWVNDINRFHTLLGTNISPTKWLFEDDFPFFRWYMLVPWRVSVWIMFDYLQVLPLLPYQLVQVASCPLTVTWASTDPNVPEISRRFSSLFTTPKIPRSPSSVTSPLFFSPIWSDLFGIHSTLSPTIIVQWKKWVYLQYSFPFGLGPFSTSITIGRKGNSYLISLPDWKAPGERVLPFLAHDGCMGRLHIDLLMYHQNQHKNQLWMYVNIYQSHGSYSNGSIHANRYKYTAPSHGSNALED